jgi:ribonuclease P protein component
MLRSVKDFTALQSGGRSRAHPLLILRWRGNDVERLRFGFSTGRKVGNAVVRNRIRRRLREALRATERGPAGGWDILVIARPASATAAYADLRNALDRLLERMDKDEGGMKKT